MNLNSFINSENIHTSSLDFFQDELQIKINAFDNKPIAITDFFKEPKKLDIKAVQNIEKLYVVGLVDTNTLNSVVSQIQSIDDAANITEDYPGLIICAVKLVETPTRVHLAEITRLINHEFPYLPVTVIFRYSDKITFANAERTKYLQEWREGEKIGKISMLKDIDLLKPHRAHQDILLDLKSNDKITSFDLLYQHWQKQLNNKELNKKFFKKIANWYFWSVAKSKFPYEYLKTDAKHQGKTDAELQDLANQKAIIRFITRIIFVWFLKEKKLIPTHLFDKEYIDTILKKSKNNANYYNAILQNLFFATLNRAKEHRGFALNKSFKENQNNYDINSLYRYENLFADEKPENIMQLFETIPFLNGGLFDSLDTKPDIKNNITAEIIDGFSRNQKWQATMPDELFFEAKSVDFNNELNQVYQTKTGKYEVKGLFEIFEEYKFTVEENTPLEIDVALDPYLLGEIFENLLAYYNPETGATARKGSGSFYTPQEIVNYMVDESLKAYLGDDIKDLQNLSSLEKSQKNQLVKKLSEVKILDPACGSGAFPMGVLYKMVDLLKSIDPDNSIWKKIQHDKIIGNKILELEADKKAITGLSDKEVKNKATIAVNDRLQELESIFNNEYNFDDYARKLFIIQNCIYGVDIQDVAIQISKLRFFLSLIIDQKNEDIKPLPNLETKFVIANTLIGIDLPKSDFWGKDDHSQDATKALKEELKKVRESHFKAVTRKEKIAIKTQDKTIREKIANALADGMSNYKQEDLDKLNQEILKQQELIAKAELMPDMVQEMIVKDLFGGESVTKVNYRKERIKECNAEIRFLQSKIASLQTNTQAETIRAQALKIAQWDIYNQNAQADWFDADWMFGINNGFDIVIGNPPYVQLQKDGGKMANLYQNFAFETFERNGDIYALFYENGLNLLSQNGNLCFITSNKWMKAGYGKSLRTLFSKYNILKLINLGSGIFESAAVDTNIILIKNEHKNNEFTLALDISKEKHLKSFELYANNWHLIKNINENNWSILSELDTQIKLKVENKGKCLKDLNLKIVRGIVSGLKKVYEISKVQYDYFTENDESLREILIPIIHGKEINKFFSKENDFSFLIFAKRGFELEKFPLIKNYLIEYKEQLSLRATIDSHPWYELQQPQMGIYKCFESERIIYPDITSTPNFSICSAGIFQDNTTYSINSSSRFLLGILNSKLIFYYYKFIANSLGDNAVRMFTQYVEMLPIIIPPESFQQYFSGIVEQILINKKQNLNTQVLENLIDNLVYKIYELTYPEVLVIDPNFKMGEDEYNNFSLEE
jgi:hypothetical protein